MALPTPRFKEASRVGVCMAKFWGFFSKEVVGVPGERRGIAGFRDKGFHSQIGFYM